MPDNQGWRISVLLSVVGVIGTLLGGLVQYYLTIDRERRGAFELRRSDAYIAFLKAFDKYRMAQRELDAGRKEGAEDLERQFELEGAAAVRSIALYGDKRVVEAMAEWYRQDPRLPPCDKRTPELAIWEGMRESLRPGGAPDVDPSDLAAVAGFCKSGRSR